MRNNLCKSYSDCYSTRQTWRATVANLKKNLEMERLLDFILSVNSGFSLQNLEMASPVGDALMLGHESWPWSSHDKIHFVPFSGSIVLFNSSVCDQVSCCLLALVGISFYNKSRIIFFPQLLMWLIMIGVIIKVFPIVISMRVILRQIHFATLIWCENSGVPSHPHWVQKDKCRNYYNQKEKFTLKTAHH